MLYRRAGGGTTRDVREHDAQDPYAGVDWVEVTGAAEYGCRIDQYNVVRFDPVTTTALRVEVQLADDAAGGILHCIAG